MGGFGSGRRGGKACTDELRQVDVRRLARDGCLTPGRSFGWGWRRDGETVASIDLAVMAGGVRFSYRWRSGYGDWQDVQAVARLTRTPCHLGGSRTWWLCPCCGRRVAILYIGNAPACRRCYSAAYRCEREATYARIIRRLDKLRDRLGWEPGILHGAGHKPKGMHWRTYWRLYALHERYAALALVDVSMFIERMGKNLTNVQRQIEKRQP